MEVIPSSGSRENDSVRWSSSFVLGESGVHMEVILDVIEDPLEEVAENNLLTKNRYKWVTLDVRTQYSLFKWSWLLNSWLSCIPVF